VLAAVVLVIFLAYAWPWYDFVQPTLFGAPFFYWWVILMYVVGTILLGVYALTSGEHETSAQGAQ
jgi:hypothetical protein